MVSLCLLATLACRPLIRWPELGQPEETSKPDMIRVVEAEDLISMAYEKTERLPGYRLESRKTTRSKAGGQTTQSQIRQQDANRNIHLVTEMPDGQQSEIYMVEGHSYLFDAEHQGWVDLSRTARTELQRPDQEPLAGSNLSEELRQLLAQFATIPAKGGQETIGGRAATRYELQPILADLSGVFDQELTGAPVELRGSIWVDRQTGALLKSEVRLYEPEASQPTQEYRLEITEIGQVAPITIPEPAIDLAAIAAATATAQAWTILEVELSYQDEPISFEITPVRVTQIVNSSPRRAEMHLLLSQLPAYLFSDTGPEAFLAQLREHLSLSIPKHNLIVTSTGFSLQNSDAQQHTLEVLYFFNVDLEDFSHIELILSRPGNPLFAPVPVE
jgi:hypothetical protein